MNYKSLTLSAVFILTLGINTNCAKEKPSECQCDCIKLLEEAVDDVITISSCDLYGFWKAPENLFDDLEKLKNWCEASDRPVKSELPEKIEGMLETIQKAIEGESVKPDGVATIVVSGPAPDCAMEPLLNLQTLLLYGCPVQIIEL